MQKKIVILALFLLLFIGGLIYFSATRSSRDIENIGLESVSAGSLVQVEYVGSLENGTVFDTSLEEIAKQEGIYNPRRPYEPLAFVAGSGQMIPGFDQGVIGMKVGEKKKLILKPEEAYGDYDPGKIQTIPRVEVINRTAEVNRSVALTTLEFKQAFNQDPMVGEAYATTQAPWKYQVKKIEEAEIILEAVTKKGDIVTLPNMPWTSEVIDVGPLIKLRHQPRQGQVLPTSFGNATLEVNAKEIKIMVSPEKGKIVQGPFGQSLIKNFNATSIILDLNHPLAGKTLIFEVEVVNISKAPQQEALSLPESFNAESS